MARVEREQSGSGKGKSAPEQPAGKPVAPGTERPAPGHPGGPPVKPQDGGDVPGPGKGGGG